jgi:periplasmic protein TonB
LTGPGAVMPYPSHQPSGSRLAGIGLVVLLHIAIIDALVNALAHRSVTVAPLLVETRIVAETPPRPIVAPPQPVASPPVTAAVPPAKMAPPPPAPVPHHSAMKLDPKPPPPENAQSTTITTVAPLPPPALPAPVQVMPHLDLAKSREPDYPAQSRQLGEQGSVVLQVLVGADGGVLDTKLVQGSGYDRLDQAALRDIKRGYRFVSGTIDGKPQPMWYTIKYNWKLR